MSHGRRRTSSATAPGAGCVRYCCTTGILSCDSTYASRNGRLAAWPVLISLFNIPEALRWQEPGHVLAGVLPFPPEWASSTEKTRIFQQCMEVIFEPLLRTHRGAELRWFYVTDATGKVVKAFPCLFGQLGDFPESSRSTATLQQGSHRLCSSCYMKETHLADLSHKSVTRTVELQRRVVDAIQSASDSKAAEKIKKRWSTHPVQTAQGAKEGHARKRSAHPGGDHVVQHRGMMQVMPMLIADNMEKSKQPAKAKREREVAAFVAYASFYKALVGVTKHTEKSLDDVRELAVYLSMTPMRTRRMVAAIKAAFPDQTSDWNIPKVHQIVHLIDGIPLRGMPNETSTNLWEHTHKGTVKVPVRGSNWHDIPRRIVEEEVQRKIAREVAAEAGGNRQYVTAMRELMVAAGIPTTTIEVGNVVGEACAGAHSRGDPPNAGGGELVPKGTFVKASPSERWFSDIAVYRSEKEEWYARCLCIFRAEGADGEMGRHVYVKYHEAEGTCPMTTCLQLSPGRVRTRYAVVPVECIKRVVHVCKSYVNKRVMLLNKFLLTE
ncbi:unnamed protein product [Closterium sp. Yama58-4]|nr:unnamed protein product [Closterium sp. Yama58-4]